MTALEFRTMEARDRFGLKGPGAAEWLAAHDIALPVAPNTWTYAGAVDDSLLVARLGTGEFFLEDRAGGTTVRGIAPAPDAHLPGVYPVLREDAAFLLRGDGMHDVLAQVCNVNFADLKLDSRPLIMTLMMGVSVLVVPQQVDAECQYRVWCDPTFGHYLTESLGTVVIECGGNYRGVSA
jgi:sarcosine oxidase, subunit gamma